MTAIPQVFQELEPLFTRRLVLRRMSLADTDAIFNHYNNPEIVQYSIGGIHHDKEQTETYINSVLNAYENNYGGIWCIFLRNSQTMVGVCGIELWYQDHFRAEIGYSISRPHWGVGYATEAVEALITFGFTRMKLHRIEAICHIDNEPSLRVLEKVGMLYEGTLREHIYSEGVFYTVKLYSILKLDWETGCS